MYTHKTKVCNKCKKEKNINLFYKSLFNKDGLMSQCIKCTNKQNKIYREKNKDKIRKRKKEYRENNIEKFKERDRKYHLENKDKIKKRDKRYYQKNRYRRLQSDKDHYQKNRMGILEQTKEYQKRNKDNIRKRKKEYYIKNKDKILQHNKKYYQKNIKKIKIRNKKYRQENRDEIRKRRYNNINHRISHNMRGKIKDILKGKNKSASTMELIGCSIEEFKNHLEKQFVDGMSWDNYGYYGWHVDHIQPCNTFDLAIPEEQKKCFNYKNTRPLWMKDNFSRPKDGSDLV